MISSWLMPALLLSAAQIGPSATISFSSSGVPQMNILCAALACDTVAIAPSVGSLDVQPGVGATANIFIETLTADCVLCGAQSGTAKTNDFFALNDGSGTAETTISYTFGVVRSPGLVAFYSTPGLSLAPIVFPDGAQLLLELPVFDPLPVANGSSVTLSVPAQFALTPPSAVPEPGSFLLIAGAIALSIFREYKLRQQSLRAYRRLLGDCAHQEPVKSGSRN
jgi:hypothetical protein